ncbi:MAG: DUF2207 domain-containing protein [Alphaproteobacteria bacterium]|nr:DUF2207 domain-containing protein [Alphaproteobacteria bacterium]
MRRLLFHSAIFFALIASHPLCFAAEEKNDITIDTDLVEILDSFDNSKKHNPHSTPKLSDILEAKGTLVFFDNSKSSGKKPKIGKKASKSKTLKNTRANAKKRQITSAAKQEPASAPVFSDRTRVSLNDLNIPQTPAKKTIKAYTLNYDGEKTLAAIPPDALIEVPFLKHIPYFFSRIEILNNGMVKVTETIERVVEPKETDFKGIDRYFPKYYVDRTGKRHRTNLTVLEASIDKKPAFFNFFPDTDGIRIAIRSEKPQMPGTHVYSITYLFSNRISEFENSAEENDAPDFKELIWEVTGTHWDIPITRAGAVIILPPNSKLYSQTAITGGREGYGNNYKIRKDKGNDLSFTLTFPLAPHEGLTILANWSDAASLTAFQNGKLDRFITEYGATTVSCIAFLFVLSYYLTIWFSLRQNKQEKNIKAAPLQKGDLSPAVLNYALKKEFTSTSLFILLLNMAAKGFLSFDERENGTLLLIKNTDKETGLTGTEKRIAKLLFTKDSTSFDLNSANSLRLKRLANIVEKRLIKEYRQKFTVFPYGYFWFGILMALITVFAVSSISLFPLITALTASACVIISIPVSFIGEKLFFELRKKTLKTDKKQIFKLFAAIFPFLLCLAGLFVYYSIQMTFLSAVFFFSILLCIGIFKTLLRSPSSLGNSILENIEGYKLYLSSQDETLLNIMRNAEFKLKALYNKHLPFAVALGLEKSWTRRFVAFSEKENQLKPDWYKGRLPFTEDFAETLAVRFQKAFPQTNTAKTSGVSPRFKKPNMK